MNIDSSYYAPSDHGIIIFKGRILDKIERKEVKKKKKKKETRRRRRKPVTKETSGRGESNN